MHIDALLNVLKGDVLPQDDGRKVLVISVAGSWDVSLAAAGRPDVSSD